jgi:hypothetical protein
MLVKVPVPPIMAGMFATSVRRATGKVERNPSAFLGDRTPSPSQGTETTRVVTVPLGLTLPHLILGIGCRKIC